MNSTYNIEASTKTAYAAAMKFGQIFQETVQRMTELTVNTMRDEDVLVAPHKVFANNWAELSKLSADYWTRTAEAGIEYANEFASIAK